MIWFLVPFIPKNFHSQSNLLNDCIIRMIKPHESDSDCVCSIAFLIDKPLTRNLVFYNVDVSHALAIYDAKRLWRAHMLS